jgi:hypothetical protein
LFLVVVVVVVIVVLLIIRRIMMVLSPHMVDIGQSRSSLNKLMGSLLGG